MSTNPTNRAGTREVPGPTPDPAVSGAMELDEVVAIAAQRGLDGSFEIVDADAAPQLACSSCGVASPPSELRRVWTVRLEGASDPADMLHVSALRCPVCATGGLLVVNYGPGSSEAAVSVLRALPAAEQPPPALA